MRRTFPILPPCAQEEMPRIRCSLLLSNWLIMGTLANCIITVCLHSLISPWLRLCCNKSLVTWDRSCALDSASLKASDRHRPCSWERQGLWQELVMNFSASYMSVAWKRIFSGGYATVWEGFIRRMCLWRKQRRKSISVLLESSWRKHRIGVGKSGLSAGTSTVGASQEIQIPQNDFSTPSWNLDSWDSSWCFPQTIQVLASKITTAMVKQWFWYLQRKTGSHCRIWDCIPVSLKQDSQQVIQISDDLWAEEESCSPPLALTGSTDFYGIEVWGEKTHKPCCNLSSDPTKHFNVANIWQATKTESVPVFWAFTIPSSTKSPNSWNLGPLSEGECSVFLMELSHDYLGNHYTLSAIIISTNITLAAANCCLDLIYIQGHYIIKFNIWS